MDGRGTVTKATRRFAQAIIAALLVLAVGPLSSALAAPTITINGSLSGTVSKNSLPEFSGTTSDTVDEVTVVIHRGAGPGGSVAQAPTTLPVGEAWSTQASTLPDGTYTAIAEQTENGETERSSEVTFTVDTTSPKPSIKQLSTPTGDRTPTIEGFAGSEQGDSEEVKLVLFKSGESAPYREASAFANGGKWSYPTAELPEGTYTFFAHQRDEAGNEGTSSGMTFSVVTASPAVTLNQPTTPSKNTTPSFTGTATDPKEPVVVHIFNASHTEVSKATAPATGGSWSSGNASPALASGTYTATATQESSLGNGPGTTPTAVTFTVNTASPAVTLTAPSEVQGTSTPTFGGQAGTAPGDVQAVTLMIYSGTAATGTPQQEVKNIAVTGGAWSTNSISALKDGTYTAAATQANTLGNPVGTSEPLKFTIKTKGPAVSLNPVPAWTNNPTPTFSGAAGTAKGNVQAITVEIYSGTKTEGTPVQTIKNIPAVGGAWSTSVTTPLQPDGTYTVLATQSDEAKPKPNTGVSIARTLIVDTIAPQVSLTYPTSGSSTSSSSQLVGGSAGTATGDLSAVTAQLFSGSGVTGGPIQSIQVNAVGTSWSTTFAGLGPGTYTARAEQSDDAGNVGVSGTSTFSVAGSAAPAAPAHPLAAFSWSPSAPHVGEKVSLLSGSTGIASPISSYAWDLAGTGAFAAGGPVNSTTFATPGRHTVQLRVTDANGLSSVAAEVIPVGARTLPFMQPFPIVRITATSLPAGIRLKLLSVRASAGALIAVKCTGHGCPKQRQSRVTVSSKAAAAPTLFRRYQRFLRAGTLLEVRVSRPGQIGKYTRFSIRRGKLPVRVDACLDSTSATPVVCPTS